MLTPPMSEERYRQRLCTVEEFTKFMTEIGIMPKGIQIILCLKFVLNTKIINMTKHCLQICQMTVLNKL